MMRGETELKLRVHIIFLDNLHGEADLEPRTKYEVDNYDHLVGFSLSPIDSYFYALPILTL